MDYNILFFSSEDIKQETVDHQNNTFQIKEESILQWNDSPDDDKVRTQMFKGIHAIYSV